MDLQGQKLQEKKNASAKTRVKVAIRVRPMIAKQKADGEPSCIEFKSTNEIILGNDRSYKFDRVFRDDSPQISIYQQCIRQLVLGCFEGYNAAVLAYGQTGSGKTFTMGSSTAYLGNFQQQGIIPRVIEQIFVQIESKKKKSNTTVRASFLEIYNEQIIDLLKDPQFTKNKDAEPHIIQLPNGSIGISNVKEEEINNAPAMITLLERGGLHRTTASTLMNEASSRSHAIFTIFIEQRQVAEDSNKQNGAKKEIDDGFITAKFFFVDLAGSERAKKTGATGATLREGININLGLLELGNVISALATIQKRTDQFITFRNSKLTRILQDCLGGNSNTYMIACVSPAESNYQESLNTLKYASKAMNIKNTPVINRDPQSALIAQLKQKVFEVEVENRKLKQMLGQKGINVEEAITHESDKMSQDLRMFKDKIKEYQKIIEELNADLKVERKKGNQLEIKNYEIRRDKDVLQLRFEEMTKLHPQLKEFQLSKDLKEQFDINQQQKLSTIEKYLTQISSLENQLKDKDNIFHQLQREYDTLCQSSKKDEKILIKKNTLIYAIGKENNKLKKELQKLQSNPPPDLNTSMTSVNTTMLAGLNNSVIQSAMGQEYDDMAIIEEAEIIETDQYILEQEKNYENLEKLTKDEISNVDKYILEKELFLEKMNTNQSKLEVELINQMKNQYHDKIALLEKEKKFLMKQKEESGTFQKNKFVSKIENLETELKDYRKKVKEQKNMQKLVDNQNSKIKDLAEEIKKFKVQKTELFRKLKEDKDCFDKLKNQRIKQLLNAKKDSLKKESTIKKLTLENQKKSILNKKKDEELKRAKRVNETLKGLMKPVGAKRQPSNSQLQDKISTNLPNPIQNLRQIQRQNDEFLIKVIRKILEEIDREQSLQKYESKMLQTETELNILLNDDSIFKLKLERLKLKEGDLTQEQIAQKQQLQMNVNDLKQRIIIAEDSITYCKNKYDSILDNGMQFFDIDTYILYSKSYETVESMRILFKSTFTHLKNLLFQNYKNINQKEQREIQITNLNDKISQLREQIMNMNTEYHTNLQQMREDMMLRYENTNQQQEFVPISSYKRLQEKQKKILQRKILDLTKSNRQINHEVEMWRRKCQIVQEKYQNIRRMVNKDGQIGRQEDMAAVKTNTSKLTDKSAGNKVILKELNQMMDGLDKLEKLKKSKSLITFDEIDKEEVKEEPTEADHRWECIGKIDAHNSSILSMALHSNILISTATKSLKIWDLQYKKIISDLSGPHLSGLVKFVMVDPERRLLFTACEKAITIWDLITLQVQGTLKSHKDEVRTIHNYQDYLFTGGKGLANSGSLLIWDLRKLNPNQAMEQKQKNQDIFTFTSNDNILYYGTRNHNVRRMNINNFEILSPFEPPHMDSVTGLTVVKNKLVSGSKDKNLRLWSLDHSINNAKFTLHAFNDYVTTVQNCQTSSLFYAGSRDGQLKICQAKNQKISVMGGILAHTQSVNAICPLDENPHIIVTASADKTIKIWQPSKETQESILHDEDN